MVNVKPLTLDTRVTVRLPSWLKEKLAEKRLEGETEVEQIRRVLIAYVTGGLDA